MLNAIGVSPRRTQVTTGRTGGITAEQGYDDGKEQKHAAATAKLRAFAFFGPAVALRAFGGRVIKRNHQQRLDDGPGIVISTHDYPSRCQRHEIWVRYRQRPAIRQSNREWFEWLLA
jgi:hypothetical protein